MNLVSWLDRHSRSIMVLAASLALAGLVASFALPVGLFPQVSFPRVVIDLDAGDRPADQMALQVTRPVEETIRSVPGVREVRSASSRGSAQISLDFGWGRDMIQTSLMVDTALAQILPSLPTGTTYKVRRMDPTTFPIIAYSLTSDALDPVALRDLAKQQIVPLLSAIDGVARVDVQGGAEAEIQVQIDPHRLDLYGLSITDIDSAIATANVLNAVGRLEDQHRLYLVIENQTMRDIDQIKDLVVKAEPSGVVRLRDVADVVAGTVPQWIKVNADSKPAVLFQVYEQPDGNSVQIAGDVHLALARFKLPNGVKLANWYDQSELVVQSASSVRDAVLIGLVLAALVLFAFLRSWRATLLAALVVPATLATTILVLSLLGMSFNIMTLGGIAAAVGLIIDDVIVLIEHIARRAGAEDGSGGRDAVFPAAQEFLRPLTGSSLATLIVFVPLSFMSGVTGAFSKALSVTMAAALLISYLLTAFLVPVLARQLIDFTRWHDPASGREGWVAQRHRRLLDRMFARPALVALGLVPLLVLGVIAYTKVGTGFMPAMDEGGFVFDYVTKPGTSLTESDRELRQIEAILKAIPDIATFSRRTGLGLGGDLNEPNEGDFFVRLKPSRRPIDQVMADVLAQTQAQVPGIEIELAQLMEDLIGDLTAVPQPIQIKLFADDPAKLAPQAEKIAEAIGKIDGVVEIKNGIKPAGDAINITVDPAMAALEGVDPSVVSATLDSYLSGNIATELPEALKQIGVRVWLRDDLRRRIPDLADLPIRASDGHLFALKRVARFATETGQPEITRDDLQRDIAVTARIEGRDLGSTVGDVRKLLDQSGMLTPGVRYELGGLYQQQQIAFAGLIKVFAAALVAEFVLLLILYESLIIPFVVIAAALLSTTAVFTGLWITGVDLNITALMGMTMVIGIATEMAIFYVSEYRLLAETMSMRDALLGASLNRFRPIAMTTLAAILTLLPLALALGAGSGMQQPLAIAVISGLVLQFPLVLLAVPTLLWAIERQKTHAAT